jgi:hypothetical protein
MRRRAVVCCGMEFASGVDRSERPIIWDLLSKHRVFNGGSAMRNEQWEEFHRGRIMNARDSARELMQVGRALDDPRSTGLGLSLLASIALVSDSYLDALEYSEQSIAVAVTPLDRETAVNIKGMRSAAATED